VAPWEFLPSQEPESNLSLPNDSCAFTEAADAVLAVKQTIAVVRTTNARWNPFIEISPLWFWGMGYVMSLVSISFALAVLIFRLYKRFQAGQVGTPERSILFQPRIDRPEWSRVEAVDTMPSLSPFFDEMGLSEQPKMLGYGRTRQGKDSGNLTRRLAAGTQKVKHRTPCGIRQRLKRSLRRICNRTVPHNV
jgi:hypothetical protein